jgi:alpha-1,2-mannosyltransferase
MPGTPDPQSREPQRLRWLTQTVLPASLLLFGLFVLVQQAVLGSQAPIDFCQDYIAARRAWQGISIYLPLAASPDDTGCLAGLVYNAHPPTATLLLLPLGLLPRAEATLLWGLLSLAAYLIAGALLLRALGWLSLPRFTLFVLASILWQPFTFGQTVHNAGQILLLILVGAWLLERRGHTSWAGALLALAALLKLWPAVFLLWGLLQGRWRTALTGGAVLVGGMVLALLLVGPGDFRVYLGPIQSYEHLWFPNKDNLSLVGAVTRPLRGYQDAQVLLPPLARGISLAQAAALAEVLAGAVLLGSLVWLWWCQRRQRSAATNLLCQSLLINVLLLTFPVTWYWGMLFLLLSGTQFLLALRLLPKPSRRWFLLLGVGLLLCIEPEWIVIPIEWLLGSKTPGLVGLGVLLFGLPTYGLLLLVGLQAHLLWRCAGGMVWKS